MEKETHITGKEGELKVIGELLRRGFDIYLPLIDIRGIDCIIKTEVGYKEIQIKTREKGIHWLFDVKSFVPRDNFYIICYHLREPNVFWVFPSKIYKLNSNLIKQKKRNILRLTLGKEDSKKRQKLHQYKDNFFQLKEGTIEATKELKAVKKSGWKKLKEIYPTVEAVEQKLMEAKEKNYSKGYIKVLENLKRYWTRRR